MTKPKREIATLDFETDPFKIDRIPEPFCCELLSDTICEVFWGDDCVEQLCNYLLSTEKRFQIFAHNGGKFDFFFMIPWIDRIIKIINGRITKAALGNHILQDSYSIIPVPLAAYDKMEFDYDLMERNIREENKELILEYLHYDCKKLLELVTAFIDRFGNKLTIGGTAMNIIKFMHQFNTMGSEHDKEFRKYYYGGRVQCFSSGIIRGPVKLFDVNSMYMAAMKYYKHPINGAFHVLDSLPDSFDMPYFVHFTGENRNALPSRMENGALTFENKYGEFFACSHELEIALEHNLVEVQKVHKVYLSLETISFPEYIDYCHEGKAKAKGKDPIDYLFYKLLGNSGYGRFAINPENFEDWIIHRDFGKENELISEGYELRSDMGELELWARPTPIKENTYCDVAVAASITSAARAILMKGLENAVEPLYCDTDSIICRDFMGDIHSTELGKWDLEHTANYCAIAGKKLYALYNSEKEEPLKLSSKGGTLKLPDILKICRGETVHFENAAPTFSLKKSTSFVKRNFVKTA